MRRRSGVTQIALAPAALLLAACGFEGGTGGGYGRGPTSPSASQLDGRAERQPGAQSRAHDRDELDASDRAPTGQAASEKPTRLTLAFAGDVHFEAGLAGLPLQPRATLGRMSRHLRQADLAMLNLESAVVTEGRRAAKELEDPGNRYWFSTPPAALELLARSGVDVVTVANNHGADYGVGGLRQTLAAADDSPVAVVGVGADAQEAFAAHRVTIKGAGVSVLAADAVRRESNAPVWAAGEGGPGIASARTKQPRRLLAAVEKADARGDLVVVYLHWGRELARCPTDRQQRLAEALASAGADVVVGAHAHVLQGSGMLGDTYVSYGLGNFAWYHGARSRTGVLKVRVVDGEVVGDTFVPARIPDAGGRPQPVAGDRRSAERMQWERLRGCTGLEPLGDRVRNKPRPGDAGQPPDRERDLPAYEAKIREIPPALRQRMTGSSHDPDSCPAGLGDLRHLTLSYFGFDGRRHTGEMVVHADHARDVVGVFEELYEARFPIRRMELVDEYGGDDNRSMAANNTSAYNCRAVAGQDTWSAHAYGAAIDINPVENPYMTDGGVLPPKGRRFADVDRRSGADTEKGVIKRGDVVMRAFERIGWSWGGDWAQPDYQHFTAR